MIVSEKSHDLSDYILFLFKKRFKVNIKGIISCPKKKRNSGNYIYDYAHSFLGVDF